MKKKNLFIILIIIFSLGLGFSFSKSKQEIVKIGVFPIQPSSYLEREWINSLFFQTLTQVIIEDIQEEEIAQVTLLPWPEMGLSEARPNLETLVAKGMEVGCSAILILKLEKVNFSIAEKRLPVIGWTKIAQANIEIKGALVDVETSAALTSLEAKGSDASGNYKGPGPDEIKDESIQSSKFQGSLLGKALNELRLTLKNEIRQKLANFTPRQVEAPYRPDAPKGISFASEEYVFEIPPGFDRRAIISVVNRGSEPQNFIIKPLNLPETFVLGLKGKGSIDSPCLLRPGEWKFVRLIINSQDFLPPQLIKLGLYVASEGQSPETQGKLQDTATVKLKWTQYPAQVTLSILSQDPVTLAYSCSLINQGEAVDNLSLETEEGQEDLVIIEPDIFDTHIPARSSLNFKIIPRLVPGFKSTDVTLKGDVGTAQQSWSFHFEMPKGKKVYYGLLSSTQIRSWDKSDCTNRGFNIILTKRRHGRDYYVCEGEEQSDTPKSLLDKFINWSLGWYFRWQLNQQIEEWKRNPPRTAADIRGATIRENIKLFIPNIEKDSRSHPMASAGDKWCGFINYAPDKEGKTSLHFFAFEIGHDGYRSPIRLNEKGHNAIWPYLRASYLDSRAYVVWEDTFQGKTNVAFRASGEGMTNWGPVVYLTNHGKGVDDPIVQVDQKGTIITAWEDRRSGESQIFYRFSRDNGKSFSPEIALPKDKGEIQRWPQVAPLKDGDFAFIYVSNKESSTWIKTILVDNFGQPKSQPITISSGINSCGEPQIAADEFNHLFAVWREGEGNNSEIIFAKSKNKGFTWTSPKQLTHDNSYSEYPLIATDGKNLFVSYHSNISDVANLKYVISSLDEGETWGEPIILPSFDGQIEDAWLEVKFILKWPRNHYQPHDTFIYFNGTQVGAIKNIVPEGIYVFKIPPEIIVASPIEIGFNEIKIETKGLNQANYILTTDTRLVIKQRFLQIPVVATSQAEADQLVKKITGPVNHAKPDLVLAANSLSNLPGKLLPGLKTTLNLRVYNLGEAPATKAKLSVYSADPRSIDFRKEKATLAEKTFSIISAGSFEEVNLSFNPGIKPPPRLYLVVQSNEEDVDFKNNLWSLSFSSGEPGVVTPLLGTDIPHIFYAPELIDLIAIADLPSMLDLISLPQFSELVSLPNLRPPDIQTIKNSLINHLNKIGLKLPDWLRL